MTDRTPSPAVSTSGAGALLRDARRAQGMHIAALAAAIKVTPQKLEALESDRFDQLPDATFTRALAQAVCRHLKIDPAPVLERLPQNGGIRLDRLGGGLNAPFRERPGRDEPGNEGSWLTSPAVWAPVLLIAGALVLMFVPFELPFHLGPSASAPASGSTTVTVPVTPAVVTPAVTPSGPGTDAPGVTPAASPAVAVSGADVAAQATAASAAAEAQAAVPAGGPASPAAATVASPAVGEASGLLVVSTSGTSWVQVVDASGRKLLSRELKSGENVGLDGNPPLRVTIGNVGVTTLRLRGEPVDLTAAMRPDRSARLQLQ